MYNPGFVIYISFCVLSTNCLPEKGMSDSVVVCSFSMLCLLIATLTHLRIDLRTYGIPGIA